MCDIGLQSLNETKDVTYESDMTITAGEEENSSMMEAVWSLDWRCKRGRAAAYRFSMP